MRLAGETVGLAGESGCGKSTIASSVLRLLPRGTKVSGKVLLDGEDVYWLESRPTEAGRNALMRWREGVVSDVTPLSFNVRTRVHEYGGGAFVVHGGIVYFSNDRDQRLYRTDGAAEPMAITPEARLRYADAVVDAPRNRLVCVREDHRAGEQDVINAIAEVETNHKDKPNSPVVMEKVYIEG